MLANNLLKQEVAMVRQPRIDVIKQLLLDQY